MTARGVRYLLALAILLSVCCNQEPAQKQKGDAKAAAPAKANATGAALEDEAAKVSPLTVQGAGSEDDMPPPTEEVVAKIRKLAAKPATPLSSIAAPDSRKNLAALRQRQARRRLLEAYQQYGRKGPKYDDAVRALFASQIEEVASPLGKAPRSQHEKFAQTKRLVELGCDDPLVLACYARELLDLARWGESQTTLERSLTAFPETKYPLSVSQPTRRLLGYVYESCRGKGNKEATDCYERAAKEAAIVATDGSFPPEERRLLLEQLYINFRDAPAWSHLVVQALRRMPGVDPWILNVSLGRLHIAKAWEARGDGFAGEVTEDGWKGFHHHLTIAGNYLVEAWTQRPDCPEAASAMIQVTRGLRGRWGDSPRFWFEQAVSAEFDYIPAYEQFRWVLRPRWGGSHEAMLAFGRECLATKRFDTYVPMQYLGVVWDLGSEQTDFRDAFKLGGVADGLRALYEGHIAQPFGAFQPNYLRTKFVRVLLWAGKREEAQAVAAQLGADVDYEALAHWRTTWQDALDDLNGSSEPTPRLKTHRFDAPSFQLKFSPDGQWLATDGPGASVLLWSVPRPEEAPVEIGPLQGMLFGLDFSPDGKLLATTSGDPATHVGEVVVWEIAQRKRLNTIPRPKGLSQRVYFADHDCILTSGENLAVQLFNWRSGELLASCLEHRRGIPKLAYSPAGRLLISSSNDELIKLWELPSPADVAALPDKRILSRSTLRGYSGFVGDVVLSRDGSILAIGDQGTVDTFYTKSLKKVFSCPGLLPAISPSGTTLAVTGPDIPLEIHLYGLQTGQRSFVLRGGHYKSIVSLAFSPDGRFLLSSGRDNRLQSWNISTGKADWSWAFTKSP